MEPRWVTPRTRSSPSWACPEVPDDFPPARPFDPSAEQVKNWLKFCNARWDEAAKSAGGKGKTPVEWDDDEDEEGADAATVLADVEDDSEAEEEEMKDMLSVEALSTPSTPPRRSLIRKSIGPVLGPHKKTQGPSLSKIFKSLTVQSLPPRSKAPPSVPTHPVSFHVPSHNCSTPKGRSHPTARKYLCAFLFAKK